MADYNIELGKKVEDLLDELKIRKKLPNWGEVLRSALSSYAYLVRHSQDDNLKVALINSDDRIVKEIELP
ncbi:MAG TPA: hypothetical protein VEP90_02855 [Methylomirabilota bacterium]|nr:hypothetical protein [Methylomirabilota bacterium]